MIWINWLYWIFVCFVGGWRLDDAGWSVLLKTGCILRMHEAAPASLSSQRKHIMKENTCIKHDINMYEIWWKKLDNLHITTKNISLFILGLPEVCNVFPSGFWPSLSFTDAFLLGKVVVIGDGNNSRKICAYMVSMMFIHSPCDFRNFFETPCLTISADTDFDKLR